VLDKSLNLGILPDPNPNSANNRIRANPDPNLDPNPGTLGFVPSTNLIRTNLIRIPRFAEIKKRFVKDSLFLLNKCVKSAREGLIAQFNFH
jgi:hypothetical protein